VCVGGGGGGGGGGVCGEIFYQDVNISNACFCLLLMSVL